MRNQKTIDLAFLSMFLAIIIVMAAIPNFGYINIPFLPGIGATIIHIPVLIACIYFGKKIGTLTGLIFGISSFIVALMRPVGPLDYVFRNPIVSILPRVLFAFIAVYIYNALSRRLNSELLSISAAAVIGTLVHSLLVLPLLGIFGPGAIGQLFGSTPSIEIVLKFIQIVFVSNSIAETVLAGLIVPPIVIALRTVTNRTTDNSKIQIED